MGFLKTLFTGREETEEEKQEHEDKAQFDVFKYDGIQAMRIGKYDYAIACFEHALDIKDEAETQQYYADALLRKGDIEGATEALENLHEMQPEDVQTLLTLAELYYQQEQYDKMGEACTKALNIDNTLATPYFIYAKAPEVAKIIKLARDTNNSMPGFVVETTGKILDKYDKEAEKIAILGVAYKGNTDDDRESPAYNIIAGLESAGYKIEICDPHIEKENFKTLEESVKDASIAIILSDHNQFKDIDYNILIDNMKTPILFDTKNITKKENIPESLIFYNYGNIYELNNL